jgi:AraC-like DNA-binding protein/quercetin dioxygenase-like cupin family protein
MSQTRQFLPDPDGFPVRGLAVTYPDRHWLNVHTHPWGQLVYAASGVMQVSTPEAAWLVPPTRAIWVPASVPHGIEMRGAVAMRTLYFTPADPDPRLTVCRALEVQPLLRELILHIVRLGMLDMNEPVHAHMGGLLLDLLAAGETAPLELPLPTDPRARGLADRLLAAPGDGASLAELAKGAGASLRTLQRLFVRETGLPLEVWRGRARMQQAVVSLSAGLSVTETALEAGYQSPSAFIAAFRRCFGTTPSRYRLRAP